MAALHHVFSRAQRAAYERVVKLLGVRRLTAGFFDVGAGVGQQPGDQLGLRSAGGRASVELSAGKNNLDTGIVDPSRLDPIQAAMYVSQMYERETRQKADKEHQALEDEQGSSKGGKQTAGREGSKHGSKDHQSVVAAGGKKQFYPKQLYAKMKKFYKTHDPSMLATIGVDNDAQVDEAVLDADLKRRFGVGLDSVS